MNDQKTLLRVLFTLFNLYRYLKCENFTYSAFGSYTENILPAAYGDLNSDGLTDLFVIVNTGSDHYVRILLGNTVEPYFLPKPELQCPHIDNVTSVVPGDYDGDGLMDVLTTVCNRTEEEVAIVDIYVHWGQYHEENPLKCSVQPLLSTWDEPLAITYLTDLRTYLFAVDYSNDNSRMNKTIFRLSKNGIAHRLTTLRSDSKLKYPHSHAFVDVNNDNFADLVLTTEDGCEVWTYVGRSGPNSGFQLKEELSFSYPFNMRAKKDRKNNIGQITFTNLEASDRIYGILPVIRNPEENEENVSSIRVYSFEAKRWCRITVNFTDPRGNLWSFDYEGFNNVGSYQYLDIPTLRAGDFNNDGYIDLLATLSSGDLVETFLLKNVPSSDGVYSRTFQVQWFALSPYKGGASVTTVMGAFYDFLQDGILDVILIQYGNKSNKYNVLAHKNNLDYDTSFIKVMVVGETTRRIIPNRKTGFVGSNLPGTTVSYRINNQDNEMHTGRLCQLSQSAHFALNLPYTIFGLGRTPNFVEDLTVAMFNVTKVVNEIIPVLPNSQLVISVPRASVKNPSEWRVRMILPQSGILLQTVFALTGTCMVLAITIGILHWKDILEDRKNYSNHFGALFY